MISPKLFRKDVPHKKLGDLVIFLDHIRKPITASEREAGLIPYYGANGIQDYVKDFLFDEDLVLLAEDGGHFEDADRGVAYKVSGKTWVNNHAHVLRPTKIINVDYLFRVLQNLDLTAYINGTTRAKLTKANAARIEIPLPPLAEQQRIATQLDTADHILKLRESTITKLDQLAQSAFVDMSSQTKNIFAVKKLGDVCDVRDGTHDSPKYVNDGIPLVTSKNLANGFIDLSNVNLISNSDFVEINKRSKVDCGDILMPMIGTIGNPVIVHDKKPQFAIKNVALIKTLKMSPSPIYIKAVLESSYFHSYVEKISRGGTQKFLGLGDIRKFEIALMKKNIEDDFVIFMNKLKAMKDLFLKNVLKNQELIASLQHQSFELNLHEQL